MTRAEKIEHAARAMNRRGLAERIQRALTAIEEIERELEMQRPRSRADKALYSELEERVALASEGMADAACALGYSVVGSVMVTR